MRLGELLIGRGFVTLDDIDAALHRQKIEGGRLGENLICLGKLTANQLSQMIDSVPPIPSSTAETGIVPRNLLNLLLKLMHVEALETVGELVQRMKLDSRVIQELLDIAMQLRFVYAKGSTSREAAFGIRYALGNLGKAAAKDALDQNLYLGPAPVSLAAYQTQIERQRIGNEKITENTLRQGLAGLVVSDDYVAKFLPAINSGRTVLLFGAPGNGKTTLAIRIAELFRDMVFIPYAVDVGGQIITVYDPGLHKLSISDKDAEALSTRPALERERLDQRWVACKRPVAMTGGEFTLDMLDLKHNPDTKFYDAPLHVKTLNGTLLIDDFGRQNFDPSRLLNRWIVPMEHQIDHLKLHSGTIFSLPFDGLVIFSTNLDPSDLMDPAFLRRIQYKFKLGAPNRDEYWKVFDAVASGFGLELTEPIFNVVVNRLDQRFGLSYSQPNFICQQVIESCRSFGRPRELTAEGALAALSNLYYDIESERGSETVGEPVHSLRPLSSLRAV